MSRKALGFNESESEDDEPELKRQNVRSNKDMIAQSLLNQSKAKELEEANSEIYQYDEVYDDFKPQEDVRAKDDGEAKYIGKLLEAKRQRSMDKLYVQDLKIQKEREFEGDEFKDKESFVTNGYKEFREGRLKEDGDGGLVDKVEAYKVKRNHNHGSSGDLNISSQTQSPIESQKQSKSLLLPKLSLEQLEEYKDRYLQRKQNKNS